MNLLGPAFLCTSLLAQPTPSRSWTNVSTLSFVTTGGNSQGQTLGFANDFGYRWHLTTLSLKASAVRASSSVTTRTAVGTTLEDAVVSERKTTTTTAEMYAAGARLDQRFRDFERFYGYASANWERNRPAGLDSRSAMGVGLGRIWADSDAVKIRTDLGVSSTYEQPLEVPQDFRKRYGTWNFNGQYKQKLGNHTLYAMDVAFADNLSNSQDWQGTLKQALTVTTSPRLALKVGYDLTYRNHPNLIGIEAFSTGDPPVSLGRATVLAKKADSVWTTSLVVTF